MAIGGRRHRLVGVIWLSDAISKKRYVCFAWVAFAAIGFGAIALHPALAQNESSRQESIRLIRRNPEQGFTLLIPENMDRVETHADADGGYYVDADSASDARIRVSWDYWPKNAPPNWMYDGGEKVIVYKPNRRFPCPIQANAPRKVIDWHKVVIQRCVSSDAHPDYRYTDIVMFPSVIGRDEEGHASSITFNLQVDYNAMTTRDTAERILTSVIFIAPSIKQR
jgi:hypothetical protein